MFNPIRLVNQENFNFICKKLEIGRKDTSDSSQNGESLSMWKGTLKLCDDDNTRICIWNAEWNVWNTNTVEGSDWWSA